MKIFLDTADPNQIREAIDLGVIDGVTTNPTHVSRTGLPPSKLYPQICEMVDGPVSLETITDKAETIVEEGRKLAAIADNVVVKIPVMREGLKAVKQLSAEGIKTNVTTNFSAGQALLSAKVGATYISPFVGRLDAIGHDGILLAQQIRTIYDQYDYQTQIIVAAARHPLHIIESAKMGADVCTMAFDILMQLYDHPLTNAGIARFLEDWKNVPQDE